MKERLHILGWLGFAALLVATFWICKLLGAGRLAGSDEAEARREGEHRNVLAEVRTLRERQPRVERELQSYVDRTLGGSLELVDGTLRARLNRLGESEGLRNLVVGTGASSARESPARSRYGRSAEQRALREEIDYVTLTAWINGEGSVDQVFRLLQRIEAEPWLKRIGTVKLEVVRGDRRSRESRLKVNIGLTTMFLPGREPREVLASAWSPERFDDLAPLTRNSMFMMPAPPPTPPVEQVAEVKPAPPPPPATTPAFPYSDWLLSGVAVGNGGPEVWLVNHGSKERLVLTRGQALHEMVLDATSGDRAVFLIDGRRIEVGVGEVIRDR